MRRPLKLPEPANQLDPEIRKRPNVRFAEIILAPHQIDRFWSKVKKAGPDDCWEWQAALNGGYGKVSVQVGKAVNRKQVLAAYTSNRVAWFLTHGQIPEGLIVCHKCDNRKCCNPSHLFLGTYEDNMQDAIRKNRIHRKTGFDHPMLKLTPEIVDQIRKQYSMGSSSQHDLAREFGVSNGSIYNAVKYLTWLDRTAA